MRPPAPRPGFGQAGLKGPEDQGFGIMATSHLRIYYGPQDTPAEPAVSGGRRSVTVPLMEVLPLLADAVQSKRTWLRDFADDEITISTDLYEVLLAYQHFRRPSA